MWHKLWGQVIFTYRAMIEKKCDHILCEKGPP